MTAPTIIIGNSLAATTTVTNSGTLTATGAFTIQSGSVTNFSLLRGEATPHSLSQAALSQTTKRQLLAPSTSALVLDGGALTTSSQAA